MYYPSSIILVSSQVVGYKGKKGQVIPGTPAQLTFPFVELFLNRCIFQDLIVIAIKAGPNILLFPNLLCKTILPIHFLFLETWKREKQMLNPSLPYSIIFFKDTFFWSGSPSQTNSFPSEQIFSPFSCSFGLTIFILRVCLLFWQVHLILIVFYAIFCILYP